MPIPTMAKVLISPTMKSNGGLLDITKLKKTVKKQNILNWTMPDLVLPFLRMS